MKTFGVIMIGLSVGELISYYFGVTDHPTAQWVAVVIGSILYIAGTIRESNDG